jgi:hypothetical protein
MHDDDLDPKRRYLCRHVHTTGHRCGSPALRAHNFCYYHDRTRLPNAPLAGRIGIFKMQPIDDRAAIQIALYDILTRITAGDIDNKRASILLYGLQIASCNLARLEKLQPPTEIIEDVTNDYRFGDLAPITELPTEPTEEPVNDSPAAAQETATTVEVVILSGAKNPGSFTATEPTSTPTPSKPVIPSEARSTQPRDPRISTITTLESTPTTASRLLGAQLFVHDEERADAMEVVDAFWPGQVEGEVADVGALADVGSVGVSALVA